MLKSRHRAKYIYINFAKESHFLLATNSRTFGYYIMETGATIVARQKYYALFKTHTVPIIFISTI